MGRRLKPEHELTPSGKGHRERMRDPEYAKNYRKSQAERYKQNKPREQFRKRAKGKEQREEVIKVLGSKCSSCGEVYNTHFSRKIQIDHKFYFRGRTDRTNTVDHIRALIKSGVDPNTQFNLLCHSCHMVVTYIRKYPEKSHDVINYLKKANIMKEEK